MQGNGEFRWVVDCSGSKGMVGKGTCRSVELWQYWRGESRNRKLRFVMAVRFRWWRKGTACGGSTGTKGNGELGYVLAVRLRKRKEW